MSKQAIDYLRKNKDKYPQEQLIQALKKNGYSDKDIRKSVEEAYVPATKYSFWNFKNRVRYTSRRQKIMDFLFGLVLPFLVGIISTFTPWTGLGTLLFLGLYLAGLIFTFNRRRFVFYGLIFWVALIFVAMIIGMVASGLFLPPFYF